MPRVTRASIPPEIPTRGKVSSSRESQKWETIYRSRKFKPLSLRRTFLNLNRLHCTLAVHRNGRCFNYSGVYACVGFPGENVTIDRSLSRCGASSAVVPLETAIARTGCTSDARHTATISRHSRVLVSEITQPWKRCWRLPRFGKW